MSSNCAFQRTKIFRLNSKECLGTVVFFDSFSLSRSAFALFFALALLFVYVNVDFLKECRTAEANFWLTLFFQLALFYIISFFIAFQSTFFEFRIYIFFYRRFFYAQRLVSTAYSCSPKMSEF